MNQEKDTRTVLVQEVKSPIEVLAISVARLQQEGSDAWSDKIADMMATSKMLAAFEESWKNDYEKSKNGEVALREPTYADVEETRIAILDMCETLTASEEILRCVRVARKLQYMWLPYPGDISQ